MSMDTMITKFKEEGFQFSYFDTKEEAVKYLQEEIQEKTVGFGGSMTLDEIGLFDVLSEQNTVYWHWRQPTKEARDNAMKTDVYISSANAIAETGEIVNIDGTGNRIAALTYGHDKVYIIVGINKVEENLERAIWRARNIAAPLNARRIQRQTPCAIGEEVRCYNCKSEGRICRGMSIINRKMGGIHQMEIVLINESLGY